jgi:hypothetical protein
VAEAFCVHVYYWLESFLVAVTTDQKYVAIPYTPSRERAAVVSAIMRGVCEFETVFNDYCKPCDKVCGECGPCTHARVAVAKMLAKPDVRTWEVWTFEGDESALVGILYLSDVTMGRDAKAHYVFFDRKLTDKTELLRGMIEWVFDDHDGWVGLHRLTVEIPDYAFATARHAARKLGFGGEFVYDKQNVSVPVEGVKREAIRWRGRDADMLVMGRVR